MPYDILDVFVFKFFFNRFVFMHILWHTDADGALNSKEIYYMPVVAVYFDGPAHRQAILCKLNALTDFQLWSV